MIMTFAVALFNVIKIILLNFKLIGREIGAPITISTKFGELRSLMLSTIYDSCDLYTWIFLLCVLFRRLCKGCIIRRRSSLRQLIEIFGWLVACSLTYGFSFLLQNLLISLIFLYIFLITSYPNWIFYPFKILLYLYFSFEKYSYIYYISLGLDLLQKLFLDTCIICVLGRNWRTFRLFL